MHVLAIIAHPNKNSYNHALMESFINGLKEAGHTCEIDDLYERNFDPCLGMPDFAPYTGGDVPPDVIEQQEMVSKADVIVVFYPVWWMAPPAIFKGWIDRVLTVGFAYNMAEGGLTGLLTDKKAIIINTSMAPEVWFRESGVQDAMINLLDKASLKESCGFKEVDHVFFYSVDNDEEGRKKYLETIFSMGKEL